MELQKRTLVDALTEVCNMPLTKEQKKIILALVEFSKYSPLPDNEFSDLLCDYYLEYTDGADDDSDLMWRLTNL